MRILIISDTHRRIDHFQDLIERMKPIDLLVHCGDAEMEADFFEYLAGCPVEMISGNNDFFLDLPREKEFYIGDYKVWLTHGHNYYVSMGNEILKEEAASRGVDIVIYGHTHKPVIDRKSAVTAINPGSLSYPRQEGRKPSYIMMELDREGKAHYHINYV